ncbi:MAG: IPT/TIG domain-containing protein, partial [Acidimicrobiales bacterium]
PVAGPLAGGTPFTITGTNLALTSAVDFCGTAAVGFIAPPAGTTVTGATPANPAGACQVTVTTPGGTATTTFTYVAPPTITSITPTSGPTAGGTPFTITGTNLAGTTGVDFCGTPATGVGPGATTVTGTTPPGTAGACLVTLTTPGGTATIGFTYVAPPTITSITPTSGPTAGGTPFTITGTNLATTTGVDFCGTPATGVGPGATTVTGTTPAGTAGACLVSVTTPGGTSNTLTFTFALVIDSFNRADSPILGLADTGQVWSVPIGIAGVVSQAAETAAAGYSLALVNGGTATGTASITAATATLEFWLIVRASDSANYWRFGRSGGGTYQLQQVVGNAIGVVVTSAVVPAAGDRLSCQYAPAGLTCSVNGTVVANTADLFNAGATQVGFAAFSAARFDDLLVVL